jgi:hypothetical protein
LILKRTIYGWLEIEPLWNQLKCTLLPFSYDNNIVDAYKNVLNATIIRIKEVKEILNSDKGNFYKFFMCVGETQYVLNTRFFVFTPYQLYKRLLKSKIGEIYAPS